MKIQATHKHVAVRLTGNEKLVGDTRALAEQTSKRIAEARGFCVVEDQQGTLLAVTVRGRDLVEVV